MTAGEPILITAIKDPSSVTELSTSQWTELLRQADDEGLSARLYARLAEAELLERIPRRAREILLDSAIYAEANAASLRFELNRIRRAIAEQPVPLIALKGIAYLAADLPPARGRTAADIDVMVPREELSEVRRTLLRAGWQSAAMRAYDVHYYETWMHEIPPIWHPERQMATDIHHTIAPLTSRVAPKADALWSAAVETDQGVKVLCPADMVLHAEHGSNASAFTARVVTGTEANLHASITAAVAALSGPAHGGAAENVMKMAQEVGDPANAAEYVKNKRKNREPVMGFGHRVYRAEDPRARHMRDGVERLSREMGEPRWFEILQALVDAMKPYARHGVNVNVDFYAGVVYFLNGIPADLFVPIFAIGRVPGWTVQVLEQQENNILIRPLTLYNGPEPRDYIPIADR